MNLNLHLTPRQFIGLRAALVNETVNAINAGDHDMEEALATIMNHVAEQAPADYLAEEQEYHA